jgi:hypothetical protein
MRRSLLFAVLTAVLLRATAARAEDRREYGGVRLEYDRGSGARACPDDKALRGAVAAQLGRDPFSPEGPRRLVASVTRRRDGVFVATMDLQRGEGAPPAALDPINDTDCRRLVTEGLALRIAIALTDPPAPVPAPPLLIEEAPEPPRPRGLPQPPSPLEPGPMRVRLGVGTGVEAGVGPTWTPTLSIHAGLRWRIVSLAFEARTDLPLAGTGDGGARVHVLLVTGALGACLHGGIFYGCAMYAGGIYRGGDQRSVAGDEIAAYSAAGPRLGFEIPFGSRFAVNLAGDVLGVLRPGVVRFNQRPVWTVGPLTGAVQSGIVAFF